MEPKISVVIPIYNVEKYIEECLGSIMNQTLCDIQVICIDDASTDNSYEKAKQCIGNDSRFCVLHIEKNSGQSYARNCGMKKAKGKYLFFLDSDDYLEKDALEKLYNYAEEAGVQGIYFGAYVEYEDDVSIEEKIIYSDCERIMDGKTLFAELNKKNEYQSATWTQFWKREYIEKNNLQFYEGVAYEDTLFTMQAMLKAEQVMCIEDILYHYRKRKASTTDNQGKTQLKSYMIVYFEVWKLWLKEENGELIAEGIKKRLDIFHRRISMAIGEIGYVPKVDFEESACQYLYQKIANISPDYLYIDTTNYDFRKRLSEYDYVFVYGAGIIADEVIRFLEEQKIRIAGSIVTKKKEEQERYKGYRIYELQEISKFQGRFVILLALSKKYHKDVKTRIEKNGYQWLDMLCQK